MKKIIFLLCVFAGQSVIAKQNDGSTCRKAVQLASGFSKGEFSMPGNEMWFDYNASDTAITITINNPATPPTAPIRRLTLYTGSNCTNITIVKQATDSVLPSMAVSKLSIGQKYKIKVEVYQRGGPGNFSMSLGAGSGGVGGVGPGIPCPIPQWKHFCSIVHPPLGNDYANSITFIDPTNSRVGIGTTNPSDNLHVVGSSLFEGITTVRGYLSIDKVTNASYYFRVRDGQNQFSSVFIIADNGRVGIGTINPIYKLDVNGTIRACEARVNATGCDFVFEKNYKLMSLYELEKFIKEKKHLPEIPSAKEVEENGIGIGEMNSKLLQKIEEMTLYMIELKKENEEIKKAITKLKNK